MNSLDDAVIHIGRVGAISQLGSLILITLFLGALHRSRPASRFLRDWVVALTLSLASIAATTVRFSSFDLGSGPLGLLPDTETSPRVIAALASACTLGFLALLVTGTRKFVIGRPAPTGLSWSVVLGALPVAGAIHLVFQRVDVVLIAQSVVAVVCFGTCTVLLVGYSRQKPSLGVTVLAGGFAAHAVLWVLHTMAFVGDVRSPDANPMVWLLTYKSLIDAVVQTLLAYGMVLVVMEEATSEIQVGHAQLEIANAALRRAAYLDPLSGAFNRRALAEGIGLEGFAAQRGGGTVALLDIDNLKIVNDSLGHEAGDALIRHVGALLREHLVSDEALYRWGGDEFLLLSPHRTAGDAVHRLDSLLASSTGVPIGGLLVPMRATVGAAGFAELEELESAVRRADLAMYERKSKKRPSAPAPQMAAPFATP